MWLPRLLGLWGRTMDVTIAAFLIAVGFVGGAWNAVAGGATLFTFPALMAAGLSPVVANATNYLAMLPSNAAAIPAYWRELRAVGARLAPLMLVSSVGAVCGSLLLIASDASVFEGLIPYLILAATALFAFSASISKLLRKNLSANLGGKVLYTIVFFSCIYGGYFGAGLGVILLAMLQVLGFSSFHEANSIKNLLAALLTVVSIVVFGVGGVIAWPEATVMMIGSAAGGYVGGRSARRVPVRRFGSA